MKYIVSRYDHDVGWLKDYTDDYVIYDRSPGFSMGFVEEMGIDNIICVNNIGSDIYDKLTYIIDNYDNLPDVAVYTKANLFKYITKEEFDKVKDNRTFTPLLTQHHNVPKLNSHKGVRSVQLACEPVAYYEGGMYWEINNRWYLGAHSAKSKSNAIGLMHLLGIYDMKYLPFAPGSNYILPKENILKHSKEFYEVLRGNLEWDVYPGEAQIIERGLYTLWK